MSDTPKSEGQAALTALDQAIAAKPAGDGHAFSATTEHLCAMRDLMIAHCRGGAARDHLERLNAVLSTTLAGHFPLGNIPWPEVEHARETLQTLLTELP